MKKTFFILSLIFTLTSNTSSADEFTDMLCDVKTLYHAKKWHELKVKRAEFLTKAHAVMGTKSKIQAYDANLDKMSSYLRAHKIDLFLQLAITECFDLFLPEAYDRPTGLDAQVKKMNSIFLGNIPDFIANNGAESLYYRHIILLARAYFELSHFKKAEELLDDLNAHIIDDLQNISPTCAYKVRSILIDSYDLLDKIKQKTGHPDIASRYEVLMTDQLVLIASDPLPLPIEQKFNNEAVEGYLYNLDLITMSALLQINDYRTLHELLIKAYVGMYDKGANKNPLNTAENYEAAEREMIALFKVGPPDRLINTSSVWMYFSHALAAAEYYYYTDKISLADEILTKIRGRLEIAIINAPSEYDVNLNTILLKVYLTHAAIYHELGKFDDAKTANGYAFRVFCKIKYNIRFENVLLAAIEHTGRAKKVKQLVYNLGEANKYFEEEDSMFHQLQLLRATYNHLLPKPKKTQKMIENLMKAEAFFLSIEDAYHRGLALYQLSQFHQDDTAKADEYYRLARDVAQKVNIPLLARQLQNKPYESGSEPELLSSSPQLLQEATSPEVAVTAQSNCSHSCDDGEYETTSNCNSNSIVGSYDSASVSEGKSGTHSESDSESDKTSPQIAQAQGLNLSPAAPRTPSIEDAEKSKENAPSKLHQKTKVSFQSQKATQDGSYQQPKRRKPLEEVNAGN